MANRSLSLLCVLCASAVNAFAAPPTPIPDKIDFNRDVRPILSDNCFFCHGPDKGTREADLRLDTKEGLFTAIGGKRMPAVPGKPAESEIIKRITTDDDDDRMPSPKSGKHLSDRDVAVLKRWIEQGAEFKGHWSYIKPTKPAVPAGGNPIDAFVLAKLEQHKLTFAKEADKTTLVRRLYLDLLGLPPTPAQVDEFVNDKSTDAYNKLVDRLLASPHFGQRMAVYWLDLVRFADTIGYHSDNPRDIAPYRDWVINAFNANQPFDQFTIEQIAGDLLPNATTAQKVASGYNRLLQTTEEGGAQPKEYIAKYNADRVRNYASVWMAGTMGCAECHDHKFDPFTAKDFYQMAAFFADVREAGVGKREPGMPVPTEAQAAEVAKLEAAVADAKKKLETMTPELTSAQQQWEQSLSTYRAVDWQPMTIVDVTTKSGAFPKFGADQVVKIDRVVPDKDVYTVKVKTNLKSVTAIRLDALTENKKGPGRGADQQFVLTHLAATAGDKPVAFGDASASHEGAVDKKKPPMKYTAASALAEGGPGWSTGTQVGQDAHAVFELKEPLNAAGGEATVTLTMKFDAGGKKVLGRFKVSAATAAPPVRAVTGKELPADVVAALKVEATKRTPAQAGTLATYFRSITPLLDPARAEFAKAEKSRDDFLKTVPRSLIAVSESPKMIRVLPRGNWNTDSGEVVGPAVPHFLTQITLADPKARPTRLDLAHWTVSKDNPLTSRVVVNRMWKLFFGVGISKSLEDLGSQGEWPTHPELLDYLAVDFQENGWDTKRLIKQLVTTRAYRQSSVATAELKELDPFNRLFARQARYRIDAEFVRDNALSMAGLLVTKIGGASVKPYQPSNHWEFLNFPTRKWEHDKAEGQYRRGLYTWWQRSFPQPSLTNFDAPSREECTAERPRSNTPQQALTLLNDPTYVEAARVFAARIVGEGGADQQSRLRFAWRTAVSREPRAEELAVLSDLYARHKTQYDADPKAAAALLAVGESPKPKDDAAATDLAAWTSVARTLLNLHETITRN